MKTRRLAVWNKTEILAILASRRYRHMKYNHRQFLAISNIGHGVNDLFWFILPLVLPPMVVTLGLNYTQAGGILTGYLAIIAVFSFIFGKIADGYSKWSMLGPGFLAAGTGLLVSGFAGSLPLFFIALGAAALGVSTFHPSMYALINDRTVSRRGAAFGMFEFWGAAAVFAMFILHGTLLQVLHWRFLLVITAVPAFVTALIFFIGRPEAIDTGAGDRQPSRPDGEAAADRSLLPKWIFGVFLASVFTRNITFVAVLNFIPTFLVFEVGVNPTMGAYASGFFFAGAMVFSVLGGKTGDRWGAFPTLLVLTVLIALSVALIGISLPGWSYFVLTFLFGCGVGGAFPPQHMILTKLSGARGSGESFGIVLAGMTLISASGPLLIGRLGDSIRLGNAILIFALPAAASVVLLLVLTASRHIRGLHREMVEAHSRL